MNFLKKYYNCFIIIAIVSVISFLIFHFFISKNYYTSIPLSIVNGIIVFLFLRYLRHYKELLKDNEELTEKYKSVIDNISEALMIFQNGSIVFANNSAVKITGYSEKELIDKSFLMLVHDDYKPIIIENHKKRLMGLKVPNQYEFKGVSKTGQVIWITINAQSFVFNKKTAVLAILDNITELKKNAEEKNNLLNKMVEIQKMEAIATLSGGIAHDFNNLLTGIQGYSSLLLLEEDLSEDIYEKITNIEKLAKSGSDLTKQLLGLSFGGKYEVKPLNLNEILSESADIFSRTKKDLMIHKKLQENISFIEGDKSQIEQVLINLFMNAYDAMQEGKSLFLSTENVKVMKDKSEILNIPVGNYVKISVTDTGTGMNKNVLSKLFKPLFTTKGIGKGTGLGLASSFNIIKNHKGIITVYSEIGYGSTFNIYIPAIEKPMDSFEESEKYIIRGNEMIMLIDDEELIRKVTTQILQTLGYNVVVFEDGFEAISYYKSMYNKIDLVILDMILPGMGGEEIFANLREINKDVKILLASGYSENGQTLELLKNKNCGFMQKPFGIEELSQKIKNVLEMNDV